MEDHRLQVLRDTANEHAITPERLRALRREVVAKVRGRGIEGLPHDVIERIIWFAYGPRDKAWRNLLFVNRYLREVTCRASFLWIQIDADQNPRLHLERSKSRGLSVSVSKVYSSAVRFEDWLNVIDPHVERWKSFSLESMPALECIDDVRSRAHLRLCHLRDYYKGRTFPALETLHVDYGRDVPIIVESGLLVVRNLSDGGSTPNFSVRNFFSDWNMPALRNVEFGGIIPKLPDTCLANITRLQLGLGDTYPGQPALRPVVNYKISEIRALLRNLPALTELLFKICHLKYFLEDVEEDDSGAELPSLRSLSLEIEDVKMRGGMCLIYDLVSAPGLREIHMRTDDGEHVEVLAEELFPKPDRTSRYECLETLSLCFTHCERDSDDINFLLYPPGLCQMLSDLPRLRHLHVSHWQYRWPEFFMLHDHYDQQYGLCASPPLRTIKLDHCEGLLTSFILETLMDTIHGEDFEMLEIHSCPNVDADKVRKEIPEGKEFRFTKSD